MSLWQSRTPGAGLDSHLPTADVLIATPFWPAYISRERIENAPNLKLLLTAGVGSDHFDLAAAAERSITVAEITGSNVVSVGRARGDADIDAGPQLHALLPGGAGRRLGHRQGGGAVPRPGRQAGGHRRVRSNRTAGCGEAQALRCTHALLRLPAPAHNRGNSLGRPLPGTAGSGVSERCGQHQHPLDPCNPGIVRPGPALQHEKGRIPGEPPPVAGLSTPTPWSRLWSQGTWLATPATSGTHSLPPQTIPGGRCPTTP